MGSPRVQLAVVTGAIFFMGAGLFAADKVQELQAAPAITPPSV